MPYCLRYWQRFKQTVNKQSSQLCFRNSPGSARCDWETDSIRQPHVCTRGRPRPMTSFNTSTSPRKVKYILQDLTR